jgi:hypothetical protein
VGNLTRLVELRRNGTITDAEVSLGLAEDRQRPVTVVGHPQVHGGETERDDEGVAVGQGERVAASKLFAAVREAARPVWIEQEVPVDDAVVLQREPAVDDGLVQLFVEVVVLKGFRPRRCRGANTLPPLVRTRSRPRTSA